MSNAIARPQLTVINGHATTTSLQVAEFFGKRHNNVLQAIRNLIAELPEDHALNFKQTVIERENPNGGKPIKSPAYTLNRDGFTLLAMGFTGKVAFQFKVAYIAAFNAMEAELARPAAKPAALPSVSHLNRDTMHRINKRAWALAQAAYDEYRKRMQNDIMVKGGHIRPEDWTPEETRREALQEIEVAAHMMEAHANVLRNRGRRLAAVVEQDYDEAVQKFSRD